MHVKRAYVILSSRRSRAGKRAFKANARNIAVIIRRDRSSTFKYRHVDFANLSEICISPVATSRSAIKQNCVWEDQDRLPCRLHL